jgi:hypothetical protein
LGALVETDEKELIFWIRGFEKLEGRFLGLPSLLAMLPLRSKMTPIEMGTSSEEKFTTSCSMLSSKTRKLSGSRPVTIRL